MELVITALAIRGSPAKMLARTAAMVASLIFFSCSIRLAIWCERHVGDFMAQQPGQFPFRIHDLQNARGNENMPSGNRKGIQLGVLDQVEAKRVGNGTGFLQDLLADPIQIVQKQRVPDHGEMGLHLPDYLVPQLLFLLQRDGVSRISGVKDRHPRGHPEQDQR